MTALSVNAMCQICTISVLTDTEEITEAYLNLTEPNEEETQGHWRCYMFLHGEIMPVCAAVIQRCKKLAHW